MKTRKKFLFFSLFFTFILAAVSALASEEVSPVLRREDASERADRVSEVAYKLRADLSAAGDRFMTQTEVSFKLKSGGDLWLDHHRGELQKLVVNGNGVEGAVSREGRIVLPGKFLQVGSNKIELTVAQLYSTSGSGLHRFRDPKDGETYVFTDFEPFDANQLFPLFDQPDLKAPLELTVIAPKAWEVISNTLPGSVKSEGSNKIWAFPATPKISSYLYALHAGPYRAWSSEAGKIPLRLFARKSVAAMVDAPFWFKITQQGLAFYGRYFGYAYPFKKYDQIIVPEFNSGAMENVAAVTFTERYLRAGKSTREESKNLADVILHEMAHMWFGNLVTMRWWNDLWLNETFATFMAAVAMAEATEYKETWEDFMNTKSWAMWEDQLVTTHPIDGPVNSTDEAGASFDGITYGKGAAVMKQLRYYLGDAAFRAGLKDYFKRYAYQNTERKDFIGALEQASKKDLKEWSKLWLEEAGLDRLHTSFACEGGYLTALNFRLENSVSSRMRPHAFELALLQNQGKKVKIAASIPLMISQKEEEWKAPAKKYACPDMVFANYKDYAYLLVQIDTSTLAQLKDKIGSVPDSMLRMMIWKSLWEMVRSQQLPVQEYMAMAVQHLPREQNERVFAEVATRMTGYRWADRDSVPFYLPSGREREKTLARLEDFFYKRAQRARAGSDQQKYYFDYYISLAETDASRPKLQGLLSGREKIRGFTFDQDRRWSVVKRLCRLGASNCEALVKAELKNDSGDRAQNYALGARAAQPNLALKEEFFTQVTKEKSDLSFNKKRTIMRALFSYEQAEQHRKFMDRYYDFLGGDLKKRDENFQESFAENLAPTLCEEGANRRLGSFLDSEKKDMTASVLKSLLIARQEDERCIRVRQLARGKRN